MTVAEVLTYWPVSLPDGLQILPTVAHNDKMKSVCYRVLSVQYTVSIANWLQLTVRKAYTMSPGG